MPHTTAWKSPNRTFTRLTTLVLGVLVVGIGSCQQAEAPKTGESRPVSTEVPSTNDDPKAVSQAATWLETWDSVYMAETKVGWIHTVFESITQQGEELNRISSHSSIELKRFGQSAVMQTHVSAIETQQGAVQSFEMEISVGPTPLVVNGTYRDGTVHLATISRGKETLSTMPWKDTHGGFFALENSLRDQPMRAGEERKLTMLMPGIVGVQEVTTTLKAQAVESVEMPGGTQQLLKIQMSNQIGNQQLDSICWTSPNGEVLKTSVPGLQQTIYRTTQKRAQTAGTGDYDLGRNTIVKIGPPLPHPHRLTRAEYKLSLPHKDPSQVFSSCGSQQVLPIDQRHARVVVLAIRPGSPITGIEDSGPSPGDLAPNSLIQTDDPQIKKMAEQFSDQAADPWAQCLALEKGVHQAIQAKNFGQGFATASDVARSLSGDCTEHSVLLAALCRAQKIPARVALGLVYSGQNQGFAFHMWNEAWVQDRWIPLDATLGLGGIGAAHLKLVHSNLAGEAAESAVLSVVQVINQLEMEVLDFQPK